MSNSETDTILLPKVLLKPDGPLLSVMPMLFIELVYMERVLPCKTTNQLMWLLKKKC